MSSPRIEVACKACRSVFGWQYNLDNHLRLGRCPGRPVEKSDVLRILGRVLVGDGCWEWTPERLKKGYGEAWFRGSVHLAHRAVYLVFGRSIPVGWHLDHLCRNRRCVRPSHMEPVTPRENALRGNSFSALNAKKTHCIQGHPLSGPNLKVTRPKSGNGQRQCRTCRQGYQEARKIRRRTR